MFEPRLFSLGRAAALALLTLTSGCVGSSTGPLALASPPAEQPVARASVPAQKVRDTPEPAPEGDATPSDRVPTADEIFQFHPHGAAWRQPFLIDPKDGPLKIRTYSAEDLAETGPATPGTEPPKPRAARPRPAAPKDPAALPPAADPPQ